ncbi:MULTISPECIES: HEAT repeat domain-containing protein [Streptomyces]|uniref:HEAT repeat domain-containing protein n=2 Tax=Streptomyces TaxID=1883 RepID=A0ABU4K957_9ACTN|nr:HEAT repeat domain-containing protein [Streptomyces roseolus]MDX2293972.1 HEAT repeat domain-containing protein [Streptomyces roseolus]
MATFVHLAPAAHGARIRRSGIKALGRGRGSGLGNGRGVYLFPVLPSYTLTHQWLRELARRPGSRGLVAVHVRLPDGEPVTVGRYGEWEPAETTAADAVRRIRELGDAALGWEVFLPRAVPRAEVRQVRTVRQVAGWRYFPEAHGVTPCVCAGCVVPGEYGSRRLRERRPHPEDGPAPASGVLLARLERAEARADTAALRDTLRWYGLRRRGPVERLAPLAGHPDPRVRQGLARAVARWSTPGADELLRRLAGDAVSDVRRTVAEAVAYRRTESCAALLTALGRDPSPAVRDAAVEGLVACATPEARAVLALLADDPDPSVRTTVALLAEE